MRFTREGGFLRQTLKLAIKLATWLEKNLKQKLFGIHDCNNIICMHLQTFHTIHKILLGRILLTNMLARGT
jgi:hypothetical protein